MKVVSTILLLLTINTAQSQGVFNNNTNTALQKVIEDYPNKFTNIKGDLLAENVQTTDFRSKVEIPGVACILTQYSATNKAVYSWRADILEEEEFENAKKRFRELYTQIKNTIIKIEGERPLILNGHYQAPTEDRKFNTVYFSLLPGGGGMERLRVELSMNHMITYWKITLTVYDREYRDDERITAREPE
ncbi:MAG: hypothetical protein EOO89_09360 [Pedobacter sp.]|nr:MAG: hypothetical protein EOO89_09360 [Pedobacter sp.]